MLTAGKEKSLLSLIGERGQQQDASLSVLMLWLRSEVVGRPLAALLANDGARVLSVDIDCKYLLSYHR